MQQDHVEPVPAAHQPPTTNPAELPASSEEIAQLLVESVQEYAIFAMDHMGRIATWNAGAQRLFGYSEAAALGQPGALVFTDEDRAAGVPALELTTAHAVGKAEDERWHQRQDGSRFWASGIMTRLTAPDGRIRGYAKIMRDNTDRKQAEEHLAHLNATLEQEVDARTEQVRRLASTLTLAEQEERHRISQILHDDLQQLLYGMQLRMLLIITDAEEGATAPLQQHAQEVYDWLGLAIQMTRQLTVDLSPPLLQGEGLADALSWLATQMKHVHGLTVTLDVVQRCVIDREEMRVLLFQLVRELLFNVVKHAHTNRATVQIGQGPAGECMVTVSDEGAGFELMQLQATKPQGFGLFSVRERLQLFGGWMEIRSQPQRGTQVTIYLPYAAMSLE